MQIIKPFSIIMLISLCSVASVSCLSPRLERLKERAQIKKDKAVNALKEKKLDAQDKAEELKEKATDYTNKKRENSAIGKIETNES